MPKGDIKFKPVPKTGKAVVKGELRGNMFETTPAPLSVPLGDNWPLTRAPYSLPDIPYKYMSLSDQATYDPVTGLWEVIPSYQEFKFEWEKEVPEVIPDSPDLGKYTKVLDDLMWVSQTDFSLYHNTMTIQGTIRPVETAKTWDEHLLGLNTRYGVIIRRLEKAEAVFAEMPELNLTGMAYYTIPEDPSKVNRARFEHIEAKVTIRLLMPRGNPLEAAGITMAQFSQGMITLTEAMTALAGTLTVTWVE